MIIYHYYLAANPELLWVSCHAFFQPTACLVNQAADCYN